MAWDFETEPEFQEKLDWVDTFVREEVEPLDLCSRTCRSRRSTTRRRKIIDPLKERGARARACGPRTSAPSSAARATAS